MTRKLQKLKIKMGICMRFKLDGLVKPAPSSNYKGPNFSITIERSSLGSEASDSKENHQINPPDLTLLPLIDHIQKHGCSYQLAQSSTHFYALVNAPIDDSMLKNRQEKKANHSNQGNSICDTLTLSCTEVKELLSYGTQERIVIEMIESSLKKDNLNPKQATQCYQYCTAN